MSAPVKTAQNGPGSAGAAPPTHTQPHGPAQDVMRGLHRAAGNGAVGALLTAAGGQALGDRADETRLLRAAVMPADGLHEREARDAADRAVRGGRPSPASMRISPVTEAATPLLPRPAGGAPMPDLLRQEMQEKFRSDFSNVRLHRGEAARQLTDQVDALTCTVNEHIFLNESGLLDRPGPGRLLMAHELAHVLQQRESSPGRIQREPKPNAKQATPADQRDLILESVTFLNSMADFYRQKATMAGLGGKPAPFDATAQLKRWKSTVTTDLLIIQKQLGGDAALTKDLQAAYQATVNALVAAEAAASSLPTHELFEKHLEDILQWALPKSTREASANTLSDAIPAAERAKIQVISTAPVKSEDLDLEDIFSTKGATSVPLPEGAGVRFSAGVPEKLQRGLKNVAGKLATQISVGTGAKKVNVLKLNSTISIVLDLEKYGGDYGLYRFTLYEHTAKKKKAKELLIERLGAVGVEGKTAAQTDTAQRRFDRHHFVFRGTWKPEERAPVLQAVETLADSLLTLVDGAAFIRESASQTKPDAAGEYRMERHTIVLFNSAFAKSVVRFGETGPGLLGPAAYDVAHEIGHAIDTRRVRAAQGRATAARQTLRSRFGQFEDKRGNFDTGPQPRDVINEFNRLMSATTAAESATDRVVTESGMRFQPVAGSDTSSLKDDPRAVVPFKQAGAGKRVSPYAEDSWEEYFAESFALYSTEPATLARLRPALFKHFTTTFPKREAQANP